MNYNPKIALSKGSGTENYKFYELWLRNAGFNGEVIDLWALSPDKRTVVASECDGVIFTGGPDIDPSRYGCEARSSECSIDGERDEIEFALFEKARELNIPMLGICRGLQLFNTALGGSLHIDIPTDVKSPIEHRSVNNTDSKHEVETEAGSLIKKICRSAYGEINSAHHQSVLYLSELLRKAATAPDGIIEAVEWSEPAGKGFLLAVQWHPERMNYDNPFSTPIARHFIFESESYAALGAKNSLRKHADKNI